MATPMGAQGQAGTAAFITSFSIFFTSALQPVSVSTMNGVFFSFSLISERMKPGNKVVTLMGVSASSICRPSASIATPALVAA